MKFDLTFLLQPTTSEKTACEKPLKCPMTKSSLLSLDSNPVSHSDETDGGNDLLGGMAMMGTSMGTTRSTSIPLPSSHVPRTQSEMQLSIDEEAAEQRDARMFYRLVNGIRERHQQQQEQQMTHHHHYWGNHNNSNSSYEQSISRLVQARLTPLERAPHHQDPNDTSGDDIKLVLLRPQQNQQQLHHQLAFHQEAADAWSISGYEEDELGGDQHVPPSMPPHYMGLGQPQPPLPHGDKEDDQEADSSPEEEGLFEMDF